MDTRKSLPRSAFKRIYYIDSKISSGCYPNVPSLAAGWETSESTINRDIDYMRIMLNAPIEYDYKHKGYYYSEKSFRLPAGFVSSEELLTLGMTKSLLSLYKNTPLYDTAYALMDVITAPLDAADENYNETNKTNSWYEDRIVVPQPASAPVPPELWNIIITALRENRMMTFDYQGVNDEDYKSRCVDAWQLLFDNGAWYLYSFDRKRKAVRMFALGRMQNAVLSTETFKLPPNYDYASCTGKDKDGNVLAQSYFGIFAGGKVLKYRIALSGPAIFLAKERTWANDQSVKKTKNGIVMNFTSTQYDKVFEWVLARGAYACPLAPSELVERWKNNLKDMTKLAKYLSL
jgi:predicted DNA-binding transcriptional regulator YafY